MKMKIKAVTSITLSILVATITSAGGTKKTNGMTAFPLLPKQSGGKKVLQTKHGMNLKRHNVLLSTGIHTTPTAKSLMMRCLRGLKCMTLIGTVTTMTIGTTMTAVKKVKHLIASIWLLTMLMALTNALTSSPVIDAG
jgi:hypothetical protein